MNLSQLSFLQKYLYFLVHIKGFLFGRFAQKYYSQYGEDIVLKYLFKGKKKGFYVDVGAYHPMHYSNTYLLYKNGWSGINIDPNPNSIRLFNIHRKKDININSGIDEEVTTKSYYIFNHQSCNTFSETQKDLMLGKPFMQLLYSKKISCTPLQQILDTNAPHQYIDLLNIDVEGMSSNVLRSINWKKVSPRVICIEDDDFDFSNKDNYGSEIFQFLTTKERAYILCSKVGLTSIYVLKE